MCQDVSEFRYRMGLSSVGPLRQTGKLIEECSELIEALCTENREGTLDALVDILYVTLGVAVAANLEQVLDDAWLEVHRANMTKTADGTLSPRGPDYVPPDLGGEA